MTPRARQRTKRPDSRRQELLDAALRLILDMDGVANLRVEDVTDAAGAAKGTFYLYFRTKDQLIAALQERFVDELLAVTKERVVAAAGEGWKAVVEAYVATNVDYYLSNVRVHDVLFHGVPDPGSADVRLVRWLAELISDGVVDGALRVRDPYLAAAFSYNALHGALDREFHDRGQFDRDRFVASAVDLIAKAVAPVSSDELYRRPDRPD